MQPQMPIRCGDCGRELGEPPTEQPCPQCGSLKRNHIVELHGVAVSVSAGLATLTVTEYPDLLLGIAEGLIPERPGIAIVVAHSAERQVRSGEMPPGFAEASTRPPRAVV